MTSISPTNHARDTIIEALQAAPSFTAFVPADRVYPNKVPNAPLKPFLRTGPPDNQPFRASGWAGGSVDGALHIFCQVTDAEPDAESWCADAVAAAADVIDALPDCFVERTTVLPIRGEDDERHGIIYWRFDAIGET